MLEILSANLAVSFLVSFLATFAATPVIAKALIKRGIMGEDVHKLSRISLPRMGGLAILLGFAMGTASVVILNPNSAREALAFVGTVLIAGGIGVVDDLHPLSARSKPLLTAFACLPIIILGAYSPSPVIPLIGQVRLTILYPLLIPIALAVTANGVNMMDVMNGSMPGTVSIIAFAATAILITSGDLISASFAIIIMATMLAFYYYNRFPAKVFSGDTGSLAVGAALGALSILGRIETVMVVALIPYIMNAFYGLASVGGLRERREIRQRPIRLLGNGLLEASSLRGAPVTIVRLILADGPMREKDIVRGIMVLTAVSSTLAVVTYLMTLVGKI